VKTQIHSATSVLLLAIAFICTAGLAGGQASANSTGQRLIDPESYHPYFTRFVEQERAFLKDDPPPLDWAWFVHNIPLIDIPDKEFEQTYYFRWYSFQKHIRKTPRGLVIDEFLDDVPWAGKYNTINAATSMHLREARWLRDPAYAEQYARFWFTPDGEPRRYSYPAADSIYAVYLANGDSTFATGLSPDLIRNYESWEKTNRDPNGLFWQIDDRDGMEDSIGGSGYRPTINSYMYGDAVAIAKIASMAGDNSLSKQYLAKAETLRILIESRLWNHEAAFYETAPRGPHTATVGVRELVGYLPWYFYLPPVDHDVAWKQLDDAKGFAGAYGPTTAERRSPRFRFADPHECLWNGPSWPFATTQTLVAMANLLNGPPQSVIVNVDYFKLISTYAHSQRIRTADGSFIPWIDEDLDPDTGEWIARNILEARKQTPANRGRYYNHSGFADLVVTGLFGVRPSSGTKLTIHPLLPRNSWSYFALEGLPYHGHLLTLFYDKTGKHYQRGVGLHILRDGVEIGSARQLQTVTVQFP
jgi:hypothetical protein